MEDKTDRQTMSMCDECPPLIRHLCDGGVYDLQDECPTQAEVRKRGIEVK